MSKRIGLIARMDKTGLGNQTKALYDMIQPDYVMIIDFSGHNGNEQFPSWYKRKNSFIVKGWPTAKHMDKFLSNVDSFITCEIPYGYELFDKARKLGIKSVLQFNYEFFDYIQQPFLSVPDVFISPSPWNIKKVKYRALVLPPPIRDEDELIKNREVNLNRVGKIKILHIQGKKAIHDRNGTESLVKALKYSREDFELTIRVQGEQLKFRDKRIVVDNSNPEKPYEMYSDYDFVVIPRRYGGLCLPMNEALASGLPVIMTDIDPNDKVLPKEWLIKSKVINKFMTRDWIDIYEADAQALGAKIDEMVRASKHNSEDKIKAALIFDMNYSVGALENKYKKILQ